MSNMKFIFEDKSKETNDVVVSIKIYEGVTVDNLIQIR